MTPTPAAVRVVVRWAPAGQSELVGCVGPRGPDELRRLPGRKVFLLDTFYGDSPRRTPRLRSALGREVMTETDMIRTPDQRVWVFVSSSPWR